MKELSIEEKAKAYDDAIAVINKSETDKYGCIIGIKPSDIFPEFKESKDEKVKRILHSISNKISSNLRDIFTEEEFQCFDTWTNVWLEKQDEQKPETIFLKFRIGDKVTNGEDTYTISFIGKDCYWVKEHDCVTIPFEYQRHWELVEQKPAWSEEDDIMTQDIEYALRCQITYPISRLQSMSAWIYRLKDRVQSQNTWKPSDEQITWLYRAVNDAKEHSRMKQILNELLSDLKKLREKYYKKDD